MNIELSQGHIALSSAEQINEICQPLLKLGITYFSFVRSYQDGSHIRLSNHAAWTEYYYKRGFYNVETQQIPNVEGNLLWSSINQYPLFYEAAKLYDIANGTVLVLCYDDIVERYFFGSTQSNKSVNYIYLHHVDLLKKFILHFKAAAKELIEKAEKCKIKIPAKVLCNEEKLFYNDILLKQFLTATKTNHVCIRLNKKDIYITANEAKILSLIKRGHTAKKISTKIGLKQKTIEIYLAKLKLKLNQYTRGNLVSLSHLNSLLDIELLT